MDLIDFEPKVLSQQPVPQNSAIILMPPQSPIKDSVDKCLSGDFSQIRILDIPFNDILSELEEYYNFSNNPTITEQREFAKDKGRLFEFVFKTGVFIRTALITSAISKNTIMYEDMKPCRAFSYKSGWKGDIYEWGADIIVLDNDDDVVWAFTAKSRPSITLSKTEWRQMLNLDRNNEFRDKEIAIGFIVNDKNEFINSKSTQLNNYKHSVIDLEDLKNIWDECRVIFDQYDWDLDTIAESVREARIPYILMPHQEDGVHRAYNAFSAGEKDFLFSGSVGQEKH